MRPSALWLKFRQIVLWLTLFTFIIIGGLTWAGSNFVWLDKHLPHSPLPHPGASQKIIRFIHKNSPNKRAMLTFLNSHHIDHEDTTISKLSEDELSYEAIERIPKKATSFVDISLQDSTIGATGSERTMFVWKLYYDNSGKMLGIRGYDHSVERFRS